MPPTLRPEYHALLAIFQAALLADARNQAQTKRFLRENPRCVPTIAHRFAIETPVERAYFPS